MLLEICVDNIEAAVAAANAGAHRLELCAELGCGGITPSYGMVAQVLKQVTVPVQVLIRPRAGNFVYTSNELAVMQRDIVQLSKLDCNGFVFGVLQSDNTIDVQNTKKLVDLCHNKFTTFHKAFDCTFDALEALAAVKQTGCNCILTSGLANTALAGIANLKALIDAAQSDITVMPGGSIRAANLNNLMAELPTTQWHSAALNSQTATIDENEIKQMLKLLEK